MHPRQTSRFTLVDGLRGIASLSVAVYHLHKAGNLGAVIAAFLPLPVAVLFGEGHLGVEIFFVLSGFVMAYTLREARVDGAFTLNFIARRSIRLDPPYWTTIALVVAAKYASNLVFTDRVAELPHWPQIVANMFYLQDLLGKGHLLDAFWTLCLEIQFYLLFVGFLGLTQKLTQMARRDVMLPVLVAIVAVSLCWPPQHQDDGRLRWFMPWLHMFLLGALTWWRIENRVPAWLWTASALVIAVRGVVTNDIRGGVVVATAALLMLGARQNALGTWLAGPVVQYLGRISYSLYLVHALVGGHVMSIGHRLTGEAPLAAFGWFAVSIAASIGAAHVLHVLVEKPGVELAKRLKLPRRDGTAAPAGTATGFQGTFSTRKAA